MLNELKEFIKSVVSNEKEDEMKEVKNVFVQVVERPARKVLIKRGKEATEYWKYCEEVGCDVWGLLTSIKSISGEPVCLWLPKKYIAPGTSEYVQGVEVELDYDGEIPEGFEVIEFPSSKFLMFQGEPFEEADFAEAGVELKVTPYEVTKKGELRAGERLVLTMINYDGPVEMDFYKSHAWDKMRLILL